MNKRYIISETVKLYPRVIPHLSGEARQIMLDEFKTYDYFLTVLTRLIRSVYAGLLGGEFIDILANLIQGQLTQAYEQAWIDDGNQLPMPAELTEAANALIVQQFGYVDQFYRDIVDARIDGTPIAPLEARAQFWAARYNEAYNDAKMKIALQMGAKLKWVEGDTKEKCDTCVSLNGIVAYASIWDRLNVHPQGAPNDHIECGGWNCKCMLVPTDERQTRDAENRIAEIVGRRK